MKTILITGGTNGIGKGLAMSLLERGNRVIVVGSSATRGEMFFDEAKKRGAEDRAHFLQADLRLVQENRKIIEEVKSRFPALDVLVLCAQAQKFTRAYVETKEGFEMHFSVYYLSRYLLSYGLKSCLEQTNNPIVVNVCAPGTPETAHWEDLQLKHDDKFNSIKALLHGSRLNDLLGVAFAENDTQKKIKYILYNPGTVQTSGATEAFEHPALKLLTKFIYTVTGKTVAEAIQPVLALVENPPQSTLSAFKARKAVNLARETFDKQHAQRLFEITAKLLERTKRQM